MDILLALLLQAIYKGATSGCQPGGKKSHPAEVHIAVKAATDNGHVLTHSASQWTTEETFIEWVEFVLVADYKNMCKRHGKTVRGTDIGT